MNANAPVLLAAVLLFTGSSNAQQLSQTRLFGPNIPQFSSVLTFDSFTGNVADLTKIEIYWQTDINGGFLVIDNDAVDPAIGSYEFGSVIVLNEDTTDVRLLDQSFQSIFAGTKVINSGTYSLAGNTGDDKEDFSSDGPDGISVNGKSISGSGGGAINSILYADFVSGPGGTADSTFDIAFDTQQYLNVLSDGGTEYAITPVNASGSVTVIYTYIPEPVTPAFAGISLALLALRRRRP